MKLHIQQKVISLHGKTDILDESDNVVYKVHSKAVSIHNKTYLEDAQGKEIAYIYRKTVSIHNIHYVEMAFYARHLLFRYTGRGTHRFDRGSIYCAGTYASGSGEC